jgi:hypothetical protein
MRLRFVAEIMVALAFATAWVAGPGVVEEILVGRCGGVSKPETSSSVV